MAEEQQFSKSSLAMIVANSDALPVNGISLLWRNLFWICLLMAVNVDLAIDFCLPQIFSSHFYYYCTNETTWEEADQSCRNAGYNLVVLETLEEFEFWGKQLKKLKATPWVGARWNATYNDYLWENTTTIVPQEFLPARYKVPIYPYCVSYDTPFIINLIGSPYRLGVPPCTKLLGFICEEAELITTTTVTEITTMEITTVETKTTTEPTTEEPTTTEPTTTELATTDPTTEEPTTTEQTTSEPTTEEPTTTESTTTEPTTEEPTTTELTTITTDQTTTSSATTTETLTSTTNEIPTSSLTPETTEVATSTSSPPTTTQPPAPTTPKSCVCCCHVIVPEDKDEQKTFIEQQVKKIQTTLTVDKDTLSSTTRKKVSAEDKRPSSTYVGFAGIVFFIIIFGSILLLDLTYCFNSCGKVRSKSQNKVESKKENKERNTRENQVDNMNGDKAEDKTED